MSKNRLKITAPAIRTREEMEALVNEITLTKLNEKKITAQMDLQIASVRERYEPLLGEIKSSLEEKVEVARVWAEANPLAFGKKKSIEFLSGTVGFRTGTPRLALKSRSWTWEKVLTAMHEHLPHFIRTKPEIDKESIIAEHAEIGDEYLATMCGVVVTQSESFFVEPNITEVETKQTVNANS